MGGADGSQSGSQRAQSSGDAGRRPACIAPGGRHTERHGAASGDRLELIWEQEAAGSNPAIPTAFSEYAIDRLSQGRQSASVTSRRPAWLGVCAGWLPRARLHPSPKLSSAPLDWSQVLTPETRDSLPIACRARIKQSGFTLSELGPRPPLCLEVVAPLESDHPFGRRRRRSGGRGLVFVARSARPGATLYPPRVRGVVFGLSSPFVFAADGRHRGAVGPNLGPMSEDSVKSALIRSV